jgi:hypothetical protein
MYEGVAGRECRRNPPQVVSAEWSGKGCGREDIAKATPAEIQDRRNWEILSAFPEALYHCGDYVQQVHGL